MASQRPKRRRHRDSSPRQRVERASENGRDVDFDFDYEETTDVIDAALAVVRRNAETQHRKVKRVVGTLRAITLAPPAKEVAG